MNGRSSSFFSSSVDIVGDAGRSGEEGGRTNASGGKKRPPRNLRPNHVSKNVTVKDNLDGQDGQSRARRGRRRRVSRSWTRCRNRRMTSCGATTRWRSRRARSTPREPRGTPWRTAPSRISCPSSRSADASGRTTGA